MTILDQLLSLHHELDNRFTKLEATSDELNKLVAPQKVCTSSDFMNLPYSHYKEVTTYDVFDFDDAALEKLVSRSGSIFLNLDHIVTRFSTPDMLN